MTYWLFAGICLAGGAGSVLRCVVDALVKSWRVTTLPIATIGINLTGSFALGLLTGLAAHHAVSHEALLVVGTGFLGGYTTFSTASWETLQLLRERHWATAAVQFLGQVVAAVALAWAGLLIAVA